MSFKNGTQSTQKVKVISTARTGKGTKLDKFGITYTRTDGTGNGTQLTASKFTSDYSEEEKALLKAASEGKDNGEVVLIKEFSQKPGQEKGFWNLKTIKPASTYVATESNTTNKTLNKGGYNEAGIKVGAVLHDAATIATTQKGSKVTIADVESIARELLTLSVKLEAEVKNGVYSVTTTSNFKAPQATTSTKQVTQDVDTAFDKIDDIEIDDSFDDFNIDL